MNDNQLLRAAVNKGGVSLPFSIYIGYGLLVPVCLSLLFGVISRYALRAMDYPQTDTFREMIGSTVPALLLFTLWGMVNLPLPVFYMLAFLVKMLRLFHKGESRLKELFLINLTHLTTMALHMILIGAFSLFVHIPMSRLLQEPFWRILTLGIVLFTNCLVAILLPRLKTVVGVLRTQAESAEVRPFMIFLWFCNVFLLLDSILCIANTQWKLLPVFLIGSTVLLEFYLIRFLRHIYLILKVHYLEEEHDRLTRELERQNQDAAELRSKSEQDSLTGIFNRQYVIDKAGALLEAGESFSLVFLDLDHLKMLNDREGHHAGDLYLIRFAEEFGACLRETDIFARVGGDEFVVILQDCVEENTRERMENIRFQLAEKFNPLFSFSYGVAYASGNRNDSLEQVFRRADQAMYQDKQARKC